MPNLRVEVDSVIRLPSIPNDLLKRLKAELTFNNPKYEDALKNGRSTRGIPRKVRSYTEENGNLVLPRGFLSRLGALSSSVGLTLVCKDNTKRFEPQYPPQKLEMWDYQEPWITSLLSSPQGVGIAPPGSGKTIMGLEAYARLGQPCLWITHTGRLVRQTRARARDFLGIETGIIGKGKSQIEHFTVGMVQTLIRRDLEELRDTFGMIIVDECHHVPASTFFTVASAFNARYRIGLTATPYRDDGLEPLIFQTLGPPLAYLDKEVLRSQGRLMTPTVIRRPTSFFFPYNPSNRRFNYKALVDAQAEDTKRNIQITTDVIVESTLSENNVCIVLVGRIAHGETLLEMISPILPGVDFVHSKMSFKKSDAILDSFETGKIQVLIATYRMLAEGFDYQPANRLFLTAPYKGRTLIEQACGRIERTFLGKIDAIVFDYVDRNVGVLNRQAEVRLDIYEANNMPTITRT